MTIFVLRDMAGESQEVVTCEQHAQGMPTVDGERVSTRPADPGIMCEFCLRAPVRGFWPLLGEPGAA